jgi:hypothetical protein
MQLEKIVDDKSYRNFKGSAWPSYENFINNNYVVSDKIKLEIDQFISIMKDQYKNLASPNTTELSISNQTRQGQIFYNKSYTGANQCRKPWNTLGVNANGNIFICSSPSWIPIFVGNLLESDNIYDILNCDAAKKIRLEILQNRYFYCNYHPRNVVKLKLSPKEIARDILFGYTTNTEHNPYYLSGEKILSSKKAWIP